MRSLLVVPLVLAAACGSANLTTGGGTGGGAAMSGDGGAAGGTSGGSTAGGSSAGGVAGGSTAGGRAGGSGGGTAGGGSTAGGSTAGGAAAGGSSAGGTAGGATAGGSAGGMGGGSAGCTAASCPTGCCLNGTCQPGTQPIACGTGGVACAQCMMNQACANQTCGLDPQSMWRIHPTMGQVTMKKTNGDNWDGFGGAPDPYVNLYCPATAASITDTSSEASNTLSPTWTDGECVVTAAQLLADGFAFSVYDADGFFGGADDSIIGKTTVTVTMADLMAGSRAHGPGSALVSISFSLTRM